MKRLHKNQSRYCGETIDLAAVRAEIHALATSGGWTCEVFREDNPLGICAYHRPPLPSSLPAVAEPFAQRGTPSGGASLPTPWRLYLSAGIHGDEPAGPLALLELLRENRWPARAELWLCPCLNPTGFHANTRENALGKDLNRDYRHFETAEIRAHVAWLQRQPAFDVTLCLHEDWEAHGFYLYELNPENRASAARKMIDAVAAVCPIDLSTEIEGRAARGGIIQPSLDPESRPQWPEAFWLLQHKTRHSYTLEAPSDFPLATRVAALTAAIRVVLENI